MGDNAISNLTESALLVCNKTNKIENASDPTIAATNSVSLLGNLDKAAHSAVESIDEIDTELSKTNVQAASALKSNAKTVAATLDNSSVFNSVKKFTGVCSDLTNVCMYANSIHNVVKDKDSKLKAGVEEGSSLLGMYAVESVLDSTKIAKTVEEIIPERYGIAKFVVAGAACVIRSLAGSIGGRAFGETITGRS